MKRWMVFVILLVILLAGAILIGPVLSPLLWILLAIACLAVISDVISAAVDLRLNKVLLRPPYIFPEGVLQLHQKLFVVDLHADPLLWKRDLLKRASYGQVDIPRMVEGNVAFQVFGIVTQSPRGQNFERNSSKSPDNITLLSVLQFWPPATWSNRFARALLQAKKLEKIERRASGKFILVRNRSDLERLIETHQRDPQVVGGFSMLEGAHGLGGKLENLDALYDAGVRIIGLAHFFDNIAGGSAHGIEKGGLTSFGRELVRKVQEKHMILDVAHSSPQVIDEVLALNPGIVISSHTGVQGTFASTRNLSDAHVRGIAATGGVIGIAMFSTAVGQTSLDATASAIRYVSDLVGVDHAAVGGDMDGSITAPIDISGMPLLTSALVRQGFNPEEITKIMGENALRVFRAVLAV